MALGEIGIKASEELRNDSKPTLTTGYYINAEFDVRFLIGVKFEINIGVSKEN